MNHGTDFSVSPEKDADESVGRAGSFGKIWETAGIDNRQQGVPVAAPAVVYDTQQFPESFGITDETDLRIEKRI